MGYCPANKKSAKTGKQILICDLAEGHESAHPLHFDKTESVTWKTVSSQPASLPSTRTSPPPAKKAAIKSANLHTQQFEVISA